MGDIKFENANHSFDALGQKYEHLYAPAFEVLVDGTNLVRQGMAIASVNVTTNIKSQSDQCTFAINNAYDLIKRESLWTDQYLQVGKRLEVRMGYKDKLETVFHGIITKLDYDYPPDSTPTLSIQAMDLSYLMMKSGESKIWKKKKYSDVVKEIGAKYTSKLVVDDTNEVITEINSGVKGDFQFLSDLAKELHFEFFFVGPTMYFRKPVKSSSPVVTLKYGAGLRSFSTSVDLGSQVSEIVVRGINRVNGQSVEGIANQVEKIGGNPQTSVDILKGMGAPKREYIYSDVQTSDEAKKQAQALLNERAMELITGSGESLGLPEIRAGLYIKLEGLGKRFAQPLYLTETTHTVSEAGFLTKFSIGGNAV